MSSFTALLTLWPLALFFALGALAIWHMDQVQARVTRATLSESEPDSQMVMPQGFRAWLSYFGKWVLLGVTLSVGLTLVFRSTFVIALSFVTIGLVVLAVQAFRHRFAPLVSLGATRGESLVFVSLLVLSHVSLWWFMYRMLRGRYGAV